MFSRIFYLRGIQHRRKGAVHNRSRMKDALLNILLVLYIIFNGFAAKYVDEPLLQFMLYKAYSADDESVEFSKAINYMQTFFNLLQVEMVTAQQAGPEKKE